MEQILVLLTIDSFMKIALGALIGLCLGLTGVGGGVLIIPILQVIFGMQTIMAVGTASIISSIVKANAGISHIAAGNVDWKALRWMLIGAIPATLLTTEFIIHLYSIPSLSTAINRTIEVVIVGIMLLSMYSIYNKYKRCTQQNTSRDHSNKVALSAGVTCGTVIGSTGVGGGIMLLPAFNTLLGVGIKKSIGSSLVMALILSTLTALNYSRGGQSDITTAILMSAGAFIGVPIAMKLIKGAKDQHIYILTLAILFLSLGMLLFR